MHKATNDEVGRDLGMEDWRELIQSHPTHTDSGMLIFSDSGVSLVRDG